MFKQTFILLSLFVQWPAVAQSYDFSQSYIFQQPYIQRINLAKARQIVDIPDVFTPYLTWDWAPEKIDVTSVQRLDDRLVVRFGHRAPLSLRDFAVAASQHADGERQQFRYLRSTARFYLVGVLFEHDQPAFLLISKADGTCYFVDAI